MGEGRRARSAVAGLAAAVASIVVVASTMVVFGFGPEPAVGFTTAGPRLAESTSRPLFRGRPFAPGERRTRCLTVVDRGAPARTVRLYGPAGRDSLDRWLHLTVAEGPGPCSRIGATDVVFSGPLARFPRTYLRGVQDRFGPWRTGEAHGYRFTIRLSADPRSSGRNTSRTFTWEGRSP